MRTVAHRGASALAHENTLSAVALAIEYGIDFVEVDVHLTRDGRLMVHHDAHVAGLPTPIADMTAAELRDVLVGGSERIPRLEEVLELADRRIGVYVELKGSGTGRALAELARGRSAQARLPKVIGGSFLPDEVAALRSGASEIPRSLLFRRLPVQRMIETCRRVGARYAHPCARPIGVGTIGALHAAGLEVMTPHTNDPAEARRFVAAGTDYLASDDPRLLREVVRAGS